MHGDVDATRTTPCHHDVPHHHVTMSAQEMYITGIQGGKFMHILCTTVHQSYLCHATAEARLLILPGLS